MVEHPGAENVPADYREIPRRLFQRRLFYQTPHTVNALFQRFGIDDALRRHHLVRYRPRRQDAASPLVVHRQQLCQGRYTARDDIVRKYDGKVLGSD